MAEQGQGRQRIAPLLSEMLEYRRRRRFRQVPRLKEVHTVDFSGLACGLRVADVKGI